MASRKDTLVRRANRVRRQIKAVANGRPRLSVHRSSKNIYAQIIDDVAGKTLASASTLEADLRGSLKTGADVAAATVVGKLVAERGVKAGVKDVVFDRGAFIYHGRIKALADAARYARRSDLARRALIAKRQRFAGSGGAREAAFFLGRLAEDNGGGALEWYDRYLSESPRGAYASQALGRKMMLVYQQRGEAAAAPLARDYLGRYPAGPYASAARKIVAPPSPAAP